MVQDLDGRVIAFNKSSLRILGVSTEQLDEGTSYRPLLPLVHEDGSPFLGHEHPSMISLRTGEPQTGVVMGLVQPDGQTRWISINSRALFRAGDTTPYAAVGSFSDITGHRRRSPSCTRRGWRTSSAWRSSASIATTTPTAIPSAWRTPPRCWPGAAPRQRGDVDDRRAAPLHDVGKIGISDTILLKPGKLTPEEFEAMKAHTSIGGRILGESDFRILQTATEIALTHHERWDGTGYPTGLRGEQIPISGRIVSVADAFDAMTHVRPYKRAFPVARAIVEIERCSGTQFDPRVVAAFLTLDHEALVDTA